MTLASKFERLLIGRRTVWDGVCAVVATKGPEYTELAEDLQEALQRYVVNECGVDENVAAYITMYSDYREQEEYLSWMKTAIEILD